MFALRTLTMAATRQIAEALDVSASAVSKAVRAVSLRSAEDPELARRLDLLARQVRWEQPRSFPAFGKKFRWR